MSVPYARAQTTGEPDSVTGGNECSTLTHGPWAYNNRKCKCRTCLDGNTAYVKAQRTRPIDPDRHGSELNYRRGCRCETCSAAQTARRRASYRRSKAGTTGGDV